MASRLPPGELERLAECVLEPIRFPSAVQPHGAVLIVDAAGRIGYVSDNTGDILGADPLALLGRTWDELLGPVTLDDVRAVLREDPIAGNPISATIGDRTFDLIVHALGDRVALELEPYVETSPQMIRGTRGAMRRLTAARSIEELWAAAAHEVRAITGYDRVMVYHFHADEHGEVVAEDRADDMEPYLGLHYPASDIPAQARALYVTKLSRQIVDSAREPAALLRDANQPEPAGLDLSATELRAVSPHHREFMRNMGQVSTFSLSLVLNGRLVGMITCAHRSERRLPFNIRDGLEILANQVSLQLASMREIERLAQRNQVRDLRSAIVSQVARSDDLAHALLHQNVTMIDLIPADGAAVRLADSVATIGVTPPLGVLQLLGADGPSELISDSLSLDHPDLAAGMPGVAGLLMRRIGVGGDFIAWFRGERRQSVKWLGDMSLSNRVTPLSPRNSFSEWVEDVEGTSESWSGLEGEARELGNDLQATLLQRAQSQLADLALRDPLTGLPNRRLFMERLGQALELHADGVAVLFVDVDRFKTINDDYGHAAGDAALVHVAHALASAAGPGDVVARLGGDEFVVLSEGISGPAAEALAQRIESAIAVEPYGSPGWRVTASIGIALSHSDAADASRLLSAADAAMYRAKLGRSA